ncbi:hypothetical protein EMCRGX_G021337 [Ephydatia muelleri]
MVQGRHGATPVGNFSATPLTQPTCPGNTGVTHVDNTLKNNVQLTWTAPPKGTGEVVFSYAVVVQNNGSINTFYATLTSPTIAELDSHGVSCAGGVACLGQYCSGRYSTCVDGYCRCPDNPDRDYCTCLANVSGCNIVENLSNSAGISYFRQVKQTLYSCLNTLPSCQYGVHVIGIDEGETNSLFFFGRDPNGMVTVSLTVDGKITVPIILVLVSYWPITWRLNLPAGVTIDRVLLTSYYLAASSVTYPQCSVHAVEKITNKDLPGSYGSDAGGGDAVGLLKYLTQRFGPVSTFSGSYYAGTWTLQITGNSSSACINRSESCVSDSVCNDGKERQCYWGDYCSGSYAIGTMCIDGSCRCPNDPNRDYCTCLARHAGCNISLDPDHAPGIPFYQGIQESVYSCSNNNSNSSYAVHILGSHVNGRNTVNTPVSISGYNLDIKPIILVLVSYKAVNWILNIPPGIVIYKVLLTSDNYYRGVSNVTYPSGSVFSVERDSHLQDAYGNDEDGSTTLELLQYVTQRFGPVSTFSGSYSVDNWKLNLGSTLPSPAVCPSVTTTPVPATNISVCPKVKSSSVTLTTVNLGLAGSDSSIFIALGGAVGFCIFIGTLSVMSAIIAQAIRQRKTRTQGNNSNGTTLQVHHVSLGVNNELHDTTNTPHDGNNLVTSTGVGTPFSRNTTAAANRLPPSYSEACYPPLVEQFTADIPPPPYPVPSSPPPVYPASGHASV